jgi:Ca-activated chloride channel family protein
MPEQSFVEFFTERAQLLAGQDQTVDVLIRVTPPAVDSVIGRRPKLNLSLVLDRSGSMEGQKMQRAREATAYCLDQLLPADRVSVVIFDDVVETLIPSQPVENKAALKARLNDVFARNSTALHEAWVRGGMQVSDHLTDGAINRVLLITDGLANVGLTNTDQIVTQAQGLNSRGVSTTTIGIGDDFNEDLLVPMATSGGGNSWHVERAEDMQRIFGIELEGLIAQVGHTVTLSLTPANGSRVTDVLNDFGRNPSGHYQLPNLQAGAPLEIVAQVRVPAQFAGQRVKLFDLSLNYVAQSTGVSETLHFPLEVEFANEADYHALPVNHEVTKAVRLLMNARARREAVNLMDAGNYEQAQQVVFRARAATMVGCAAMPASAEVQEELASLDMVAASLNNREADKSSRKRLLYNAVQRVTGRKQ